MLCAFGRGSADGVGPVPTAAAAAAACAFNSHHMRTAALFSALCVSLCNVSKESEGGGGWREKIKPLVVIHYSDCLSHSRERTGFKGTLSLNLPVLVLRQIYLLCRKKWRECETARLIPTKYRQIHLILSGNWLVIVKIDTNYSS